MRGHWPYACYDQYDPQGSNAASIANITTLANQFAHLGPDLRVLHVRQLDIAPGDGGGDA